MLYQNRGFLYEDPRIPEWWLLHQRYLWSAGCTGWTLVTIFFFFYCNDLIINTSCKFKQNVLFYLSFRGVRVNFKPYTNSRLLISRYNTKRINHNIGMLGMSPCSFHFSVKWKEYWMHGMSYYRKWYNRFNSFSCIKFQKDTVSQTMSQWYHVAHNLQPVTPMFQSLTSEVHSKAMTRFFKSVPFSIELN